ncbi:MAG: heme lyase CcmF/NrfE family subunit [Pseudomonadota bacterium]
MTAEIGHFALILAFMVAIVQASVPLLGAARGNAAWIALAPRTAIVQALLVLVAFAALMWGYIISDFSIENVAVNSHTAKPLIYKISGTWGNHEGSLLLWALMLTGFGAAVALTTGALPDDFRARVLAVQAMIGVGFIAFILFTSNPFARLDPAPIQGNGLNPLLQDPGLAIHPPFLYLGYVGFSVAFSFAAAALIEGHVTPAWARWVRPWALAAWGALSIGIGLGSWWAYYELGWGGFWFWDPVENASVMPWIAGTALIHSIISVEKRDTLKRWTILLAVLAFSLSLLGTFIVRSGVLVSVHAFATDPTRGVFILAFLAVAVGGALTLYAWRAPRLLPGSLFAPISREGGLVLNNLIMCTVLATVFVGTLYPLFLDALGGEKISVGPPYFNAIVGKLAIVLAFFMSVGPELSWKRAKLNLVWRAMSVSAVVTLLFLIGLLLWKPETPVMGAVGMAAGVWLLTAVKRDGIFKLLGPKRELAGIFTRLRRLSPGYWGMQTAHGGVAVILFAISAAGAFEIEVLDVMKPGDSRTLGKYEFVFDGIRARAGENYTAIEGGFRVSKDGELVAPLYPQTRTYTSPTMTTTEAAIHPLIFADLFAVVGEPVAEGWTVRLYVKPFISWLWVGIIALAIGAVISMSDRRLRLGLPARRTVAPAKPVGALQPEPAE